MIRIGIVDDHVIVRTALRELLSQHVDMRVVAEAGTAEAAVGMAESGAVDMILMDLVIPGDGMHAIAQISQKHPSIKILALSGYPDDVYGVAVIQMGARGYVSKAAPPVAIVEAIRKAAAGGKVLSSGLAEKLQHAVNRQKTGPSHELLSPREMEVLRRLAAGTKLSVAADEMGLSIKTASTYRKRVLDKLVLDNNQDLTRYALAHGLIT